MILEEDRHYLKRSVELAEQALEKGNAPFGSLLVSADGKILFEDHNHNASGNETRHPEFEIARWAADHLTLEERKEAVVYTSGEHCSMCSSAHGLAGLGRIVYASSGKQLQEWKEEFNIEPGPLQDYTIEDIIKNAEVDGPDNKLAQAVKELQKKYYTV